MVYLITDDQPNWFPHPAFAPANGLLAVTHTLNPDRVALAYHHGIFPWETYGDPPLWHWFSPDPRCILIPCDFKPGRYLRAALRKGQFEIRVDTAFESVMRACATIPRPGTCGESWIEEDMIQVYTQLHHRGYAHSFEAWLDGKLVGGLYGLSYGKAFFGESMFHKAPEASRVALAALVSFCLEHKFHFIDCQQDTPHIIKLGAKNIPRKGYLEKLREATKFATIHQKWTDLHQAKHETSTPPIPLAGM